MGIRSDAGATGEHDLESTAKLPVLDIAAYEAQLAAAEAGDDHGSTTVLPDDVFVPSASAATASIPILKQAAIEAAAVVVAAATPLAPRTYAEEHDRLHKQVGSFQAQVSGLHKQIGDLTGQIARLSTAMVEREAREGQLIAELQEMRAGRDDAEARLRHAASEAQTQIHELETALAAAEAGSLEQSLSLSGQNRQAAWLNSQLAEARAQLAAQTEARLQSEVRRGIWEGLLHDAESAGADELRTMRAQVDSAQAAQRELQQELENAGAQRAQAAAEFVAERDALRQLAVDLESRALAAEQSADSVAASLLDLQARFDATLQQFTALESDSAGAATRIDTATQAAATAEAQLAAAEDRARAFETDLEAVRSRLAHSEARAADLDAELISQREYGADVDSERARRDQTEEALTTRCAGLEAERDALRLEVDRLGEMVRSLESRAGEQAEAERVDALRTMQGELRQSGDRVGELEGDLRAAEEQIHRLEGELRLKTSRLEEVARSPRPLTRENGGARRRIADPHHNRSHGAARSGDLRFAGDAQDVAGSGTDSAFSDAGAAATADGVTRYFVLTDGDTEIVHVLGRRTTIGRGLDNDIRIDTKYVSRHHSVVLAGPAQTVVEDLRSTNGVLVNGRRVTRSVLRDGDIVHVGKSQFRFVQRTRDR